MTEDRVEILERGSTLFEKRTPHWAREWLYLRNLSQVECARALDVHVSQLNQILKGSVPCPEKIEQRLQNIKNLVEEREVKNAKAQIPKKTDG